MIKKILEWVEIVKKAEIMTNREKWNYGTHEFIDGYYIDIMKCTFYEDSHPFKFQLCKWNRHLLNIIDEVFYDDITEEVLTKVIERFNNKVD